MKKTFNFVGLLLASLLIIGIGSGRVRARLTGTDPGTDVFCVGPSGAEVCIDVSGNVVPTTASVGSLGTTALPFSSLKVGAVTATGAVVVTSITASGSVSADDFIAGNFNTSRWHPPALSSGTIKVITPTAVGDHFTWVSALNVFIADCVSSNTTGGAIIVTSSTPKSPCYEP